MVDLLQAIAAISMALHEDRVEQIAIAVERFDSPTAFNSNSFPIFAANADLLTTLRRAWLDSPTISGREVAFGLRTAVQVAKGGVGESVDVVWTGPRTGLIPTRSTEQVLREVIDEARQQLFIVSFVFYNAASIVESLINAIERNVTVRVLLESSTDHGGTVSTDNLRAMHNAVPRAELYVWNPAGKAVAAGLFAASVHAKCVVADDRIAFVTSANLTAAALERNMELGILIRGGVAPNRLHSHLNALIQTGTIVAWS